MKKELWYLALITSFMLYGGNRTAASVIMVRPGDNISSIVDMAQPGDTILFKPGIYAGPVRIETKGQRDRPVVLISEGDFSEYAVIDGGSPFPGLSKNNLWIDMKNSSWIEIINMKFQNGWTDPVQLVNSSYISFKNCYFAGGRRVITGEGINTHHILIENCYWDQGGYHLWNINRWTDGDAWESMHHGDLAFFNGSLFDFGGTSGGHVIRGNTIVNAFNGIRWRADQGMDMNIEIYENRISYIRDNDFEPEAYAFNLFIHHNFTHNVHKTLSIDNVNGGNIYYFGNVITTDNASRTRSISTGFYKIYGEDRNVSEPVFIFNNSYFGTGKVHGSVNDRLIANIHHYNNAFHLTARNWELNQWNATMSYDYDCSNKPFSAVLLDNGQEQHGIVAPPGYTDPVGRDLRLRDDSPCIDSGKPVTLAPLNWSQSFTGKAPDIGAFENDQPLRGPFFRIAYPDGISTIHEEMPRVTQLLREGKNCEVSFSHPINSSTISGNIYTRMPGQAEMPIGDFQVVNNGYTVSFELQEQAENPLSLSIGEGLMGLNNIPATNWANAAGFEFIPKEDIAGVLLMPLSGGTISMEGEEHIREKGSAVKLKAIANEGYAFKEWEGDVSGANPEVSITLENSIWAMARFEKIIITALDDQQFEFFKLYPNPTSGIMRFESKMGVPVAFVSITDCTGRRVYSMSNPIERQIDLSGLLPGIYIFDAKVGDRKISKKVWLTH